MKYLVFAIVITVGTIINYLVDSSSAHYIVGYFTGGIGAMTLFYKEIFFK